MVITNMVWFWRQPHTSALSLDLMSNVGVGLGTDIIVDLIISMWIISANRDLAHTL